MSVMDTDETAVIEPVVENKAGCRVRRKIEDLLEERMREDELGFAPPKTKESRR